MDFQQLIMRTIEKLELTEDELAHISINLPTQTITIIDTSFRKFVGPFPPPELPFPEEEPRPKRTKAVKRVGNL